MTPTQRSLAHLRQSCDLIQVVEKWNPHARIRQDLFGCVDILALRGAETIAIQACAGASVSARVDKITNSDAIKHLRNAGWKVVVHGWRKVKVKRGEKAMKWELREVDLS